MHTQHSQCPCDGKQGVKLRRRGGGRGGPSFLPFCACKQLHVTENLSSFVWNVPKQTSLYIHIYTYTYISTPTDRPEAPPLVLRPVRGTCWSPLCFWSSARCLNPLSVSGLVMYISSLFFVCVTGPSGNTLTGSPIVWLIPCSKQSTNWP